MNLSDMNDKTRRLVEQALDQQERIKRANAGVATSPLPTAPALEKPKARLRQRTKPLLNRLETAFLARLEHQYQHGAKILSQAITLKIGNGVRYTPDFVVVTQRKDFGIGIEVWEVKGPHSWDDSIVKLKVAAALFPWIAFNLASGNAGTWRIQQILS